ncbi:MAG: hypothetical protein M1824_000452 [Vezdaea acicularis]|nr:MAG: hypothetical protein M1824_000452 [Vezdaea acicularis]
MSTLTDRKDNNILDAINHDDWKHAIQLCQKRIKKGEKGDYLFALHAYVLCHISPPYARGQPLDSLYNLTSKEPPVLDIKVLGILQDAFEYLLTRQDVGFSQDVSESVQRCRTMMWERAMKAKPNDETLLKEWFTLSFKCFNWKNAQKASMALQKTVPNRREYYFWAVLANFALSITPASQTERKLFGALAFRMVSKAAEDATINPETLLSPGRSIVTQQELHLLLEISKDQKQHDEAILVLSSASLGLKSDIAKNDWSFVRADILLKALAGRYLDVWNTCKAILLQARQDSSQGSPLSIESKRGDDWFIWNHFIDAQRRTEDQAIFNQTAKILDTYFETQIPSRNVQLARLKFSVDSNTLHDYAPEPRRSLLVRCRKFYADNMLSMSCFNDLMPYAEQMTNREKQDFLQYTQEHSRGIKPSGTNSSEKEKVAWAIAETNSLKFSYFLKLTRMEKSTEDFENFILKALELCEYCSDLGQDLLVTDNRPGDGASILAATAFFQLSNEGNSAALFKAVALLDHLLTFSKHNYQALLLQLRLYQILGTHSQAFKVYGRLYVKKMQYDTLAHNIVTRLSTSHPFSVASMVEDEDKVELFDPKCDIRQALKFFDTTKTSITRMSQLALEQGSYSEILEFLDVSFKIDNSFTKQMMLIEQRRIERLTSRTSTYSHQLTELPTFHTANLVDSRSFDLMMDCQPEKAIRVEELISHGVRPNSKWIQGFALIEHLMAMLVATPGKHTVLTPLSPGDISQRLAILRLSDTNQPGGGESTFTTQELRMLELCEKIAYAEAEILKGGAHSPGAMKSFSDLEEILKVTLKEIEENSLGTEMLKFSLTPADTYIDYRLFQRCFGTLEMLQSVMFFLRHADQCKYKLPRTNVSRIKTIVHDLFAQVRSIASSAKNKLTEGGILSAFVNLVLERRENDDEQGKIGAMLEKLAGGETSTEIFAGRIIESWLEALDGVLRVKID